MRDREKEDVQCYPAIARHGNLKEEENENEGDFEQRDQNEDSDIQKVQLAIFWKCNLCLTSEHEVGISNVWFCFAQLRWNEAVAM